MSQDPKQQSQVIPEIVTVDDQRRFYFERSKIQAVLGMDIKPGDSEDLWLYIGGKKQLRVLRKEHELSKARENYEAGNLGVQPDWEAGENQETDIIRKLNSLMKIKFRRERENNKYLHITLPTESVKLGLAKADSFIVVFISGQNLELWHPDIWNEAHKISKIKEFTKQIQDIAGS